MLQLLVWKHCLDLCMKIMVVNNTQFSIFNEPLNCFMNFFKLTELNLVSGIKPGFRLQIANISTNSFCKKQIFSTIMDGATIFRNTQHNC